MTEQLRHNRLWRAAVSGGSGVRGGRWGDGAATIGLVLLVSLFCQPAAATTNVAVFNFQMKSDTPEWRWLEKGLADRIITDLFQDKSLSVVQRDEMQRLAARMGWAPEMMANPHRLDEIRKALKPRYLISGFYEVKAGRLDMTAVIVDLKTRKEVARRHVTGAAVRTTDRVRELSAALLSWLTRRPAAQVLRSLPVWTRDLPAARMLYEGIELYDQGRYAEAWRKFRSASRQDPAYTESRYWVGKMYYFMDRYEHARRAYERFVYMDQSHARLGDAIKEYLHTYEKLNAPAETLLELYDDLRRRFPDAAIHNVMYADRVDNRCWLWTKSGLLLQQLGRLTDAVATAAKAQKRVSREARDIPYRVVMGSAQEYNLRTGRVLMPKPLADHYWNTQPLRFSAGQREVVGRNGRPLTVRSYTHRDGQKRYYSSYGWWLVAAPQGHVFKSLCFYPIVEDFGTDDTYLNVYLHKDSYRDIVCPPWGRNIREVAARGARFDDIPRTGLLHMHMCLGNRNRQKYSSARVVGVRAVAEFEQVGAHGTIDVACDNVHDFFVDVDGRLGRKRAGLIGLVAPGEHVLRFRPGHEAAPVGESTMKVIVTAGETRRVTGRLPWKQTSGWSKWKTATLIGRDYEGYETSVQTAHDAPSIQADAEAIRVVWTHGGDLWQSVSTDGRGFSRPARLAMPVSSGWTEEHPRLLRDESGRFLLVFLSDRNVLHESRAYACWSRDFAHWSAPTMVLDRRVSRFDVLQDDRGRFVFADTTGKKLTIAVSRDLYRWEKTAQIPLEDWGRGVAIVQRDDGAYDLFVANAWYRSRDKRWPALGQSVLRHYTSRDLASWTGGSELLRHRGPLSLFLSPVRRDGQTTLACFRHVLNNPFGRFSLFRRTPAPASRWQQSPATDGLFSSNGAMAWHPRWGYMIAWKISAGTQFPSPARGPFLVRGPSIKPLFRKATK